MQFKDLHSERLELVEINLSGLEDFHEYSLKKELYTFLEQAPINSIEETKNYLKKLILRSSDEFSHYWFIRLRDTKKVIGTFGIHDIDFRKSIGEVSYGVSPDYSGRGYFKEALGRVLKYAFEDLDLIRISAVTRSDNLASINGLISQGFKLEGTMEKYYLSHEGKRFNASMLAILKD